MDSAIIVKVLAISETIPDKWEVLMLLGEKKYEFTFTVERDRSEPQFLSIVEDRQFSQLFQFNSHISSNVLRLLIEIIQGVKVEFPQELGCFLTPEQALAQQRPLI